MDKKKFIDFNIDLSDLAGNPEKNTELIESCSSINILFQFQSQNPFEIRKAIGLCKHKHKVIGASIVLPDGIENPLSLSEEDIESIVLYQLGAIDAFATAESMNVEYVRTRGLMYQLMSEDLDFSVKVAKAIKKYNKWFLLYGASSDILSQTADLVGINVVHEVCLNNVYANNTMIDFSDSKKLDNDAQLARLKKLMNQSELDIGNEMYSKIYFDTIHFDSEQEDILNLLNDTKQIVSPRPVNFNKAAASGWIE